MRTLNDTIEESETISELDWFDKQILSHLTINYFEKNLYCKTHLVSEKYGMYEDLNTLSSLIYRKIASYMSKNNVHKNTFKIVFRNSEFQNLKNIFFEQLELTVIIDSDRIGEGEYFIEYSNLDENTLLFDKVCISVFTNRWLSNFEIALQHELTHAYEHWNRQLKNDNCFTNKLHKDFYSSLQNTADDNELKRFLKDALYFTLDSEQNAFASELTTVLKKSRRVIKTPLEALEILKQTHVYQIYKELYFAITEYDKGNIPTDTIDYITLEYNKICNTNLTSNKVFKKLKHLIQKSLNKFDALISKLCCENLKSISMILCGNREYTDWRAKQGYNITEIRNENIE